MPIYEYRCAACRRRTSLFVRSAASSATPKCEHCGSLKVTRLMSRFAVHRGGSGDLDDLGGLDDVDENDPQSIARWARRMKDEVGEDMGPEFDEMVGRIEAGEDPESVMGEDEDGGAFSAGDDF
jgi:putative FmdB family regulatory protein